MLEKIDKTWKFYPIFIVGSVRSYVDPWTLKIWLLILPSGCYIFPSK